MEDLGAILYSLGQNIEGVARQLQRRRRDYTLNELESLRETLLTNAGTIEAVIRLRVNEAREDLAEIS